MKRNKVESSNIKSIGYDLAKNDLEIEFQTMYIYVYHDVPKKVFRELMNADSIGKYFHQNIRDKYKYEKVGVEK